MLKNCLADMFQPHLLVYTFGLAFLTLQAISLPDHLKSVGSVRVSRYVQAQTVTGKGFQTEPVFVVIVEKR